jgi:hypothetical protein
VAGCPDGCSDAPDGLVQALRRMSGIAEDESGRSGELTMPGQRVDEDPSLPDLLS